MGISFMLLTQSTTPVIGWIAWVLGWVMNLIYEALSAINIHNVGLCIIIFTIVVNLIMLPVTIKQQRSAKISAFIQPEMKKIQSKYRGRNDTASQQAMQQEMQALNEKYGISMFGGCLPLLIQLPILYGLYAVIRNIPAYVTSIKEVYMSVVTPLIAESNFTSDFPAIMEGISTYKWENYVEMAGTVAGNNWVVDVLSHFTDQWNALIAAFPNLTDTINSALSQINVFNYFCGMNLQATPSSNWMSIMIIIPILAGVSQFISIKLTSAQTNPGGEDGGVATGMSKSMMYTMPIMSIVFCFILPIGLGLYWIASAVVRTIITILVNHFMKDVDPEELIAKSEAKRAKKKAKQRENAKSVQEKQWEAANPELASMSKSERINAAMKRVQELDKEREAERRALRDGYEDISEEALPEDGDGGDDAPEEAAESAENPAGEASDGSPSTVYEYLEKRQAEKEANETRSRREKTNQYGYGSIPLSVKAKMVSDYEEREEAERHTGKKKKKK